jgi:hypothetical protein
MLGLGVWRRCLSVCLSARFATPVCIKHCWRYIVCDGENVKGISRSVQNTTALPIYAEFFFYINGDINSAERSSASHYVVSSYSRNFKISVSVSVMYSGCTVCIYALLYRNFDNAENTIRTVTYKGGFRKLYTDVGSDWNWIYLRKITTTTDHNHWEQLSTGSFLNLLLNSFLMQSLERTDLLLIWLTSLIIHK